MRFSLALALVGGVVFGSVATAATSWFTPWREIRTQGYVDVHGGLRTRYQWRTVQHPSGACLIVLTDEQSGHFALTHVEASVCGEGQ